MLASVARVVEYFTDVAGGFAHHLFVAHLEEQPTTQGAPGSAAGLVADAPQEIALEIRHGAIRLSEPNMKGSIVGSDRDIETKAWSW